MASNVTSTTPSYSDHSISKILGNISADEHCSKSVVYNTSVNAKRTRRCPTNFTEEQKQKLEAVFYADQYPGIDTRERLAEEFGIAESRIQVWFQNRRNRQRRLGRKCQNHPRHRSRVSHCQSSAMFDHSTMSTYPPFHYWPTSLSHNSYHYGQLAYYPRPTYFPHVDTMRRSCHVPSPGMTDLFREAETRVADMTSTIAPFTSVFNAS